MQTLCESCEKLTSICFFECVDPLRIAEFSVHAPLLSETDVEGNVSLSFHSDDSLYSEVYNQQERIAHVSGLYVLCLQLAERPYCI